MNAQSSLWGRLAEAIRPSRPAKDERWVVLDTETSGFDPERDDLLAVGAVAVDAQGIRVSDSFEAILRNEGAGTAANVVVHGIGHGAQREGLAPEAALRAFASYVGDAPCIAFHAAFDRAVLARALREAALAPLPGRWLDVSPLAAVLDPAQGGSTRGLDDWLDAYAIDVGQRHNAAADALATAELLLRLRAQAGQDGVRGFDGLVRLAAQKRWLAPGG